MLDFLPLPPAPTQRISREVKGGGGGGREGERGDSQVGSAVSLVPRLSCMDGEKRTWYALFAHSSVLPGTCVLARLFGVVCTTWFE